MAKFNLPPLNALRAFEAAARHQSIKKASGELHVAEAAISRHIQHLEQQIDRKLFNRQNRRLVLTDAGRIALSAVTLGFTQIQRAFALLRTTHGEERLIISADPDFAGLWLVPRLTDFYASVPNALVEIRAEKTFLALPDSGLRCSIQYFAAGSDVENGELLFRSHLFPVCAKELVKSSPLNSPEDLRHHVLLHDRSIVEWDEYLRMCSTTFDPRLEIGPIFNENSLCLDAAVRGQGVAMGDDFLAASHLAAGRLIKPFTQSMLSKNAYYFIASPEMLENPLLRAFRDWLFQRMDGLRANS
jgi:LysR family glycine cleavage system transcriptional activator